MPKKLTTAQVARIANRERPGAWKAMSADERQQLTDMLNEHAKSEADRRAEERRRKAQQAAALKTQSAALDRFMAQFAPKKERR